MHISAASALEDGGDAKRRVLKDVFGFDDFRPGQAEVMEALLGRRHVVAVMPPGAGQEPCFQVSALGVGGPPTLVSPAVGVGPGAGAGLRGRRAAWRAGHTVGAGGRRPRPHRPWGGGFFPGARPAPAPPSRGR